MADWTLRPVEPVSLTTVGINRDSQRQPRDQRAPSRRPRPIDRPAILQRLMPGADPAAFELDFELNPQGDIAALIVRRRQDGRVARRLDGPAIEGLLRERSGPGLLVERSG